MKSEPLPQAARDSAAAIINTCLKVKPAERLLILADPAAEDIARDIWTFAASEGLEPALVLPAGWAPDALEPPDVVGKMLSVVDAVIWVSDKPVIHTRARREACEKGVRVVVLPDPSREVFEGAAVRADYDEISLLARSVAGLLTSAQHIAVVTGDCRLEMFVAGRDGHADTGIVDSPGRTGLLPAGEAFIAPLEGTAEGDMLVDGSILGRVLEKPIVLRFRAGRLLEAEGDAAGELMSLLDRSPEAKTLAELGVGCNPGAVIRGRPPEDEKVLGTVHVALGTNATFGGLVWAGLHVDAVTRLPDLYLDGRLILSEGKLLVDHDA